MEKACRYSFIFSSYSVYFLGDWPKSSCYSGNTYSSISSTPGNFQSKPSKAGSLNRVRRKALTALIEDHSLKGMK